MAELHCFRLMVSNADNDAGRPDLDFSNPVNQGSPWQIFREISLNMRDVNEYEELHGWVDTDEIERWHGYGFLANGCGFYSSAVCKILERYGGEHLKFLPVRLNGVTFFAPFETEPKDVLDKDRSEIVFFRSNPQKVKGVYDIQFDQEKLSDPMVFCMPELPSWLLLTSTPALYLDNVKVRGIELHDASGRPAGFSGFIRRTPSEVLGTNGRFASRSE